MKNKNINIFLFAFIILILAITVGIVWYFYLKNSLTQTHQIPINQVMQDISSQQVKSGETTDYKDNDGLNNIISSDIKNKCKKTSCDGDCLDGWSYACFYDSKINKKSDFKLGFKVEPNNLCFGARSISTCGDCVNKFEINQGDKFIEVSCEDFYQNIENKNKECGNCIGKIETSS